MFSLRTLRSRRPAFADLEFACSNVDRDDHYPECCVSARVWLLNVCRRVNTCGARRPGAAAADPPPVNPSLCGRRGHVSVTAGPGYRQGRTVISVGTTEMWNRWRAHHGTYTYVRYQTSITCWYHSVHYFPLHGYRRRRRGELNQKITQSYYSRRSTDDLTFSKLSRMCDNTPLKI